MNRSTFVLLAIALAPIRLVSASPSDTDAPSGSAATSVATPAPASGTPHSEGAPAAPKTGHGLASEIGPRPCSDPEYRQFDFWLGDWEVRDTAGELAGTNSVRRIMGNCVLQENWEDAVGGRGTSFNMYDSGGGKWHQTWVDDKGSLLELDGKLTDGKMVLSGTRPAASAEGGVAMHRITWSPMPPDQVHQLWEISRDGGKTWSVNFDGMYARRTAASAEE